MRLVDGLLLPQRVINLTGQSLDKVLPFGSSRRTERRRQLVHPRQRGLSFRKLFAHVAEILIASDQPTDHQLKLRKSAERRQ